MTVTELKIRLYGDPCLKKKSTAVSEVGRGERELIQSMIATMYANKGVGLAAVQVGVDQRIFVADIGNGPIAFINPQIFKKSGSSVLEEGCLSIPDVTVEVRRAERVSVRYTTEENEQVQGVYEGLMARVIQHENDHLNGKMIVDYAGFAQKIKLRKKLKEIQKISQESQEKCH